MARDVSNPELKPWCGEPQDYALFAVTRFNRVEKQAFEHQWLSCGGSLDLRAARLRQRDQEQDQRLCYALWLGRTPHRGLLHEKLAQPAEWSLHYRRLADGAAESDPAPNGLYWPWYHEPAGPVSAANGKIVIVMPADGAPITFPADALEPFFTGDGAAHAALVPLAHTPPLRPLPDAAAAPPADVYQVPCGLRPAERPHLPLPDARRERLQRERAILDEMLEEDLRYREAGEAPPVWMQIYTETKTNGAHGFGEPGSADDLRRWFSRASLEGIRQYEYARARYPRFGTLHFVRPSLQIDPAELKASPPSGRWSLCRDGHWWSYNRQLLFLPQHLELKPHPPRGNPQMANLLSRLLWGNGAELPTVAILRCPEPDADVDYLLRVTQFTPLESRLADLNIDVAFARLEPQHARNTHELLREIRTQTAQVFQAHCRDLRAILDKLWEQLRQLREFDDGIGDCVAQVSEIQRLRAEIAQFEHSTWFGWTGFRNAVLRTEQRMALDPQTVARLEQLDGLWDETLRLGRKADPRVRDNLRRRLTQLLASLEDDGTDEDPDQR